MLLKVIKHYLRMFNFVQFCKISRLWTDGAFVAKCAPAVVNFLLPNWR